MIYISQFHIPKELRSKKTMYLLEVPEFMYQQQWIDKHALKVFTLYTSEEFIQYTTGYELLKQINKALSESTSIYATVTYTNLDKDNITHYTQTTISVDREYIKDSNNNYKSIW